MDGKTIVLGNSTGGVIHTSKNDEYGYIRVEQERSLFDNKGFLRRKNVKIAEITIKISKIFMSNVLFINI